tara:strand:+ start:252 stop:404 length:153 start_codon:yes stop_codon:yes gene_type:complete
MKFTKIKIIEIDIGKNILKIYEIIIILIPVSADDTKKMPIDSKEIYLVMF